MDEEAGHPVDYLQTNAAHRSADDGFLLPQSLRHCQTKSFTNRFLKDHGGPANERVDFEIAERRQKENVDVFVFTGGLANFREYLFSLGIVCRSTSRKNKLAIVTLLDELVGTDHAQGILE